MKRIRREYYFISVLLICFSLLTLFVAFGTMDAFDEMIFNKIIMLKNVPLTAILRVITHLASTFGIVALMFVTATIFYKKKIIASFKYVLINVLSGVVLMEVLKNIVRRARPVWKWISQDGFSYPSGHTISALLLYGTLMLLVYKKVKGKQRKPLLIVFSLMIILTGVSRVYFGAHYLTDVVASLLLGSIIILISNIFMNKEFYGDKNKVKK